MKNLIIITPNEPILSIAWRFIRSFTRSLWRPPGMNHYCPGESGSGEWCCRSSTPSVCGYCGEPNV